MDAWQVSWSAYKSSFKSSMCPFLPTASDHLLFSINPQLSRTLFARKHLFKSTLKMPISQRVSEFFPPKPTFTEANLPSLAGRTYLVTGGAAGIGKELTRMLYWANAKVYVAGRNLSNIEKATKEIVEQPGKGTTVDVKPSTGTILPLILDLADLATIKPAIQKLQKEITRLDAVFLNAGVMTPPKGSKTVQNYELQWGTNVVGHFLLQKLLIPLLQSSAQQIGEVRIIWTSSDGSEMSPAPDGIYWDDLSGDKAGLSPFNLYSQSKAGNVILAAETAERYATDNIVTASLNPGHLKTELQRHSSCAAVDILTAPLLYEARFGALTELFAGFSDSLSKENSGSYIIPWGRHGAMAKHIQEGLKNGSGARLWELLDKETVLYS
jgi:retinol dehydrogenase-12